MKNNRLFNRFYGLTIAGLLIVTSGDAWAVQGCRPPATATNDQQLKFKEIFKVADCLKRGGMPTINGTDLDTACGGSVAKDNAARCKIYNDFLVKSPDFAKNYYAAGSPSAPQATTTTVTVNNGTNGSTNQTTTTVTSTNGSNGTGVAAASPSPAENKYDVFDKKIGEKDKSLAETDQALARKDWEIQKTKNDGCFPPMKCAENASPPAALTKEDPKDCRPPMKCDEDNKSAFLPAPEDPKKLKAISQLEDEKAELEAKRERINAEKEKLVYERNQAEIADHPEWGKSTEAADRLKVAEDHYQSTQGEFGAAKTTLKDSRKLNRYIDNRTSCANPAEDGSCPDGKYVTSVDENGKRYKKLSERVSQDGTNRDTETSQAGVNKVTKEEIALQKQAKKDARAEMKTAKKELKRARAEARDEARANQIRQENKEKKWGGLYGGLDQGTDRLVNGVVGKISEAADKIGAVSVAQKNQNAQTDLASKGMTASVEDFNEVQRKNNEAAAKALKTQALIGDINSSLQLAVAGAHMASRKKVGAAQLRAESAITSEEKGASKAKMQLLNDQRANVKTNARQERTEQLVFSAQQVGEGGKTALNAAANRSAAQALNTLNMMTPPGAAPNFSIGMDPGSVTDGSVDGSGPQGNQNPLVASNEGAGGDKLDTRDTANTGDMGNIDNPLRPESLAQGQAPSAGGGGAPSAAGAGGTSAAKEDDAGAGATPKKEAPGAYASSEGGSGDAHSGGSSNSADPGVGIDKAFQDLLAKFLPSSDEKKGQENGQGLIDRSPASNQAAVIGRSKNIFEEVHKRYLKKNSEGAILF